MTHHPYDVAVVGGGPAGLSAGIRLANSGLRIVLLEAGTFPRDKVCGEFLSPECQGLLGELGMLEKFLAPILVRALGDVPRMGRGETGSDHPSLAARISSLRLSASNGAVWDAKLPGTALGVSRRVFDALLAKHAEAAGVDLHTGSQVRVVTGSLEQGYQLRVRCENREYALHARTVIAAHGKRSQLDRTLQRPFFQQSAPFLAFKAHFLGPRIPNRVELHAFPGGYCGLSEVEGDRRNVCLLVRQPVFARIATSSGIGLPAFLRWMQTQNAHLGAWFAQAHRTSERWLSIAQVSFAPREPFVNGMLMAGDSAGLISPLAGDGIAMALETGLLAALHAERYLLGEVSGTELEHMYRRAWQARYATRMRLARVLQGLLLRPQLAGLALPLLRHLPKVGALLIRGTRSPSYEIPPRAGD